MDTGSREGGVTEVGFAKKQHRKIQWASPQQKYVFMYPPMPVCASGGFGSAKTHAFCLKCMYLAEIFPRSRTLIARKTLEHLKTTTMSTFFKLCDPKSYANGKRSDGNKYLQFDNGSEILWAHLDSIESENFIRGVELNFCFIDQAEELYLDGEEIFDMLLTRLGRWDQAEVPEWVIRRHGGMENWPWFNPVTQDPIPPTYMMLTCNPGSEDHWIYRRFHPRSEDFSLKFMPVIDSSGRQLFDEKGEPILESYEDRGYKMVTMRSRDNKFLPEANKREIMSKDQAWRRQYEEGKWGQPEGQIHTIDERSILITDPRPSAKGIKVDPHEFWKYATEKCVLGRAMDHGDAAPTCCLWWACDGEGNIFFLMEYYKAGEKITFHRREITGLSGSHRWIYNVADPSIFYRTMQKQGQTWSVALEYADTTYDWDTAIAWEKGQNDELAGRNRVNELLEVDPNHIHPITKEKGSPRMFFLERSELWPNGCHHVIVQTRNQQRIKIGSQNGKPIYSDTRNENVPDHAYDPLRYAAGARARKFDSKRTVSQPGTFGHLMRQARRRHRGQRPGGQHRRQLFG